VRLNFEAEGRPSLPKMPWQIEKVAWLALQEQKA